MNMSYVRISLLQIVGRKKNIMKTNKSSNQLKIGVVLSYAATGINMVIQLLYTPIMIKLLGQSEYGLYTLVGSVVSYLSLFSLGFSGAYLRFYSKYRKQGDEEAIARLNGLFLMLFLGMAIVAFSCGMILAEFTPQLFGTKLTIDELEKAKILMQILVINIALTFPSSVFESIVSAHEQYLFQRTLTLAGIIFNPFICLPLLLLGYGSIAVVSVTTGITFAKLSVNIWFCYKKLHVRFVFQKCEVSLVKEIAGFSFFIFLNMVIDQINWAVDKFILGRIAGTAAVAVYGVGAQINSLFIQFSTAVSSVFSPRVNRIAAEREESMNEQFTQLFIKVGRIQFVILMLIASGFIIFGKFFITAIYATAEYEQAYWVTLWLILPAVIPLIQNVGIEVQRAVNKHRTRAVIYLIMAFINIIISIPLAIKYKAVGSAIGTAISLLVANGLIMNIYYRKVIGIDIIRFWKNIVGMSKGLIIPAIMGVFIKHSNLAHNIYSFMVWVCIYAVIYCISIWFWGLNGEEQNLIYSMIYKVKKIGRKI